MDVSIMPKTNSLVKVLQKAFPELTFKESDDFRWSPQEKTVYFDGNASDNSVSELLHETAHGLLSHADYDRDIQLLGIERDAWTHAQTILAPRFGVTIDQDLIEDALDSYRDWLHARSLCPDCRQTGIQNSHDTYFCLGCDSSWQTNEARRCALRRYKLSQSKIPVL